MANVQAQMHTSLGKIESSALPCLLATGVFVFALTASVFLAVRFGGMLGLAAIVGVATLSLVVAVHPFIFFVPYFVALFFADTRLPGLPVSANQMIALLFAASWIGYFLRGRCQWLHSRVLPWLTLMTLYFTVSALTGESPPHGQILARYVVIYYAIAVMLAMCLRSDRAILAYAWIIVAITFLMAVGGLVEALQRGTFTAFGGKITDAVRVKGAASTANVYGWNLVFAFPFAFFIFTQARAKFWRLVALGMGLFILFVALLTLSRQTVVLVGLQLVLCARLFHYAGRRRMLVVIAIFLALGGALAAPAIIARFLSVTQLSRDYSYLERRDSAIICLEVIKARPIFGVGLGSYTAVWRNYLPPDYRTFFAQYIEASRPRVPDEGYLQITAEGGFVGLAIFLVFVGVVFIHTLRVRREAIVRNDSFANNLSTLVLALMVHFLATTFLDDTFLYVRVWLIYPLALLMDRRMIWDDAGEVVAGDPREARQEDTSSP